MPTHPGPAAAGAAVRLFREHAAVSNIPQSITIINRLPVIPLAPFCLLTSFASSFGRFGTTIS
jgi:hypothetical protein